MIINNHFPPRSVAEPGGKEEDPPAYSDAAGELGGEEETGAGWEVVGGRNIEGLTLLFKGLFLIVL